MCCCFPNFKAKYLFITVAPSNCYTSWELRKGALLFHVIFKESVHATTGWGHLSLSNDYLTLLLADRASCIVRAA